MQDKMPLGLKIILVFSILETAILMWEILNGTYNTTLFGLKLSKNFSLISHIITLGIFIAWIVSLIKRYSWGWKLFIAHNFFVITSGLVGVFTNSSLFQLLARSIIFYMALIIIIFMSYYVYRKRSYFNK